MYRLIRSFSKDSRGNIALMMALLAPLMMAFVGGGIDFYRWSNQRASMKELADTLATRGAREFLLANASEAQIKSVIKSAVGNDIAGSFNLGPFEHLVKVNTKDFSVRVTIKQPPKPGLLLTNIVPYSDDLEISSTAVARGGMNVCVVALEKHDSGAVAAEMLSEMVAKDCSILSNSKSPTGVKATVAARIHAGLICSAGGYAGAFLNYNPAPTTDCPVYDDPLALRMPDPVGGCDFTNTEIGSPTILTKTLSTVEGVVSTADGLTGGLVGDVLPKKSGYKKFTLKPGVYCGGLNIGSDADVKLKTGVYVMKNGPFAVALGGRVQGENVSFHLTGDNAVFYFGPQSRVELSAMETGALAGILFFEERDAPEGRLHQILSANARVLLGTFYLPAGTMRVASLLPVADNSAYTAIVARKLQLNGSPSLVLNADYTSTSVPVPEGVGPVGGSIFLRE